LFYQLEFLDNLNKEGSEWDSWIDDFIWTRYFIPWWN